MTDSSTGNQYQSGAPEVTTIPDQYVAAGREVEIDFSEYVTLKPGETVTYSIQNFPSGFSIDEHDGTLTGITPTAELNESFMVALTVTNPANGLSTKCFFRLEVAGTILLDTEEGKIFFGDTPVNFWDAAGHIEIRQFIQQLLNEHFVWLYFYDGHHPPQTSGEFLQLRQAKSGWNIYHFANVIMINAGNKTYEQYGNRGRLLDTLREIYQQDIKDRSWELVGINGSDDENVGRAWIIGKQLNAPVNEEAPTEIAEINYLNLQKLYNKFVGKYPKPTP